MNEVLLSLYGLPLAAILWLYVRIRLHREGTDVRVWRQSVEAGLVDPPSLHPVFDPTLCMGSGACTKACPEKALGFVNGKAQLVNPTACIGHGACAATCPVEAITLVFGTARRGIDIPYVKPTFETNVPGIFIAGELGGMGLIRKAAEQGKQAIESIRKRRAKGEELDVVIVGAGPAGLSATLAAMEHKLKFVTLEQESSLGGTVYHYPRNKIVMTQPVTLPLVGKMKFGEVSKEGLLEFWQGIVNRVGVPVQYGQRVEKIVSIDGGFEVVTSLGKHRAKSVLLALGRRGTPRKLDVPGEHLPKVVYRLVDAEQYRGKHVLVVGGGDAAIEAALNVAEEPGSHVTLSYRGEVFGRLKQKNRHRLEQAQRANRLTVVLHSHVLRITKLAATLKRDTEIITLKNDAVIICAGGILPIPMLKEIGIMVDTKHGTA
jgi:thioredoxin reductase/ferredoxin